MEEYLPRQHRVSRRAVLRTATGAALAAASSALLPRATWADTPDTPAPGPDVSADARSADDLFRELDARIEAAMADGDTLFRIGSTTKTFTGTTMMRLVEQGLLDLDTPIRTYLPDLTLADKDVAARVTLRQLLNHSAGSLIETVTGQPYEAVVRELLLDPLGLNHSFSNADDFVGYTVAASHTTVDGVSVVHAPAWRMQRSLYPTGGFVSSARDLLRYARFHLSDGADIEGPPVLSAASLQAMRMDLGPGGTLNVEIDGVGVSWFQRTTAEGVPVYQHGGLLGDLFVGDWSLQRFLGLHNPPAVPQTLTAAQLAPYEGRYTAREIDPPPGDS